MQSGLESVMSAYERLVAQTATAQREFIGIALIQDVLANGAPKELYLDFLGQAFHHVKCTAPLMARAASRCGAQDRSYQSGLFDYIAEERGHEEWILEDIAALGGDAQAVRNASPRLPCKVMVGHAYYVVDHVSPYGLLGMIHVLEGMAVALASNAVQSLRRTVAAAGDAGFKYLTTHSDLDVGHAKFFAELIDAIDSSHLPLVIECTRDFYVLYGNLFRDLDARRRRPAAHAA
jgi:pyrroloquinoline quinone (PQQ) biosynthesis protein C